MDINLLDKLYDLREKIKNEKFIDRLKKKENKKVICNDEVLHSIVNLMPEKLSDFRKIRGVGDSFIEKYAQMFLDVINEHKKFAFKTANKKEIEIIHKLNNKLVNINQKNRLLYCNKLSNKYGFDLTRLNNVNKIVEAFLNESSKQFVIAKVNYDKDKSTKSIENFNALKTLYREVETVKVEKGQEILYLGYPYVEGKIFNDFKIKAPLILFPAEIEMINNEYRLKFDNTRNILYNSTLAIAYNKFNNKNEMIDDGVIEEISKDNYIQDAVYYFKRYQVLIENKPSIEIEPFLDTTNSSFPQYDDSKLHLKGYAVLGSFPTYSNAIQRDYSEIIDHKIINNLVSELFIAYNDTNGKENDHINKDVLEKEIFYINAMNHSQETILSMIEKEDALVIEGPPGTGKSQTITSLISQAVLNDKKVLVVSEKKTALDVIYNRLGKISDFVMYIDDPNNKTSFYQQLKSLLELDDEVHYDIQNITEKAEIIDNEINKLKELETLLDTKTSLNASLRDLYHNSNKLNFTDEEIKSLYKEVCSKKTRKNFTLDQMLKLRQMFRDSQLYSNLIEYKEYLKYESIYSYFKPNILETDLYISTKDFYEIPFYIDLYKKFGFITKLRLNYKNKNLVKTINSLVTKIGGKQRKRIKRLLYDDVYFFINAVNVYPKYLFNKNLYNSLNKTEKRYFEYCFHLSSKLKISFFKVNEYLLDIFTNVEIMNFEQKYSNVLITTERYKDICKRIAELTKEKEQLTFECLFNYLQSKIIEVFNSQSKRLNELKRKCDSKRKWSITKLINEFKLELFNSIYVWLLTPEGVSEIMPLKQSLFDLIIFDEASQMYIENAVPILYRGKKCVIAGDTKQLRPSKFGMGRIDSEDIEDYDEYSGVLEEESLLDLAKHRYHELMLNYHYRSKYEELIAFSNYAFYEGKLHVCPNPVLNDEKPIERIKVNGRWVDRKNDVEASEIITLLKKIFLERKDETIGIITFNSTQKDLILDKIEQECLYNPEFYQEITKEKLRDAQSQLFVKNIENVQGDERDIIIFSVGYAPNENNRIVRQFGWLNNEGGENRLNVAISRAKKKVYVVTSIEPFELQVSDLKNNGPKLLRNYLEYVKAISENDQVSAQKILYSLNEQVKNEVVEAEDDEFIISVYNEFVNLGYEVDRNVGTGLNKISLALRKTNEKDYLIGLELDTTNQSTVKECDYHRPKYLENSGWIIHRIWCSDWWRNKQSEIDKVLAIINKE